VNESEDVYTSEKYTPHLPQSKTLMPSIYDQAMVTENKNPSPLELGYGAEIIRPKKVLEK
jgi:hypothetical protein